MSAWARLVNWDGSDEFLELCNEALEEVQTETSRRNAAKIQAEYDAAAAKDMGRSHFKRPYLMGLSRAKKLIEPQKEGQ